MVDLSKQGFSTIATEGPLFDGWKYLQTIFHVYLEKRSSTYIYNLTVPGKFQH